jgi:hypothetical protein
MSSAIQANGQPRSPASSFSSSFSRNALTTRWTASISLTDSPSERPATQGACSFHRLQRPVFPCQSGRQVARAGDAVGLECHEASLCRSLMIRCTFWRLAPMSRASHTTGCGRSAVAIAARICRRALVRPRGATSRSPAGYQVLGTETKLPKRECRSTRSAVGGITWARITPRAPRVTRGPSAFLLGSCASSVGAFRKLIEAIWALG